jgi:hypothetical protein
LSAVSFQLSVFSFQLSAFAFWLSAFSFCLSALTTVYHILARRFKPQANAEHVGECVGDACFDFSVGRRAAQ